MEEKKVKIMPKRCKCGRFLRGRIFTASEKKIEELKKITQLCDRCIEKEKNK